MTEQADDNRPGRVLAIHSGALGDVILFGRLLERFGGHKTLVAGRQKAKLLAGMGVVDAAIDFDSLPMHEIFSDKPADQCSLPEKLGRYDLLISCFAGGQDSAERRLREFCKASEAFFLPTRPPVDFAGHLVEFWANRMRLHLPEDYPAWSVPDKWISQATNLLINAGAGGLENFVAIHPGSGGREKCWPLENFKALARQIEQNDANGLRKTVWLFGEVELERWGRDVIQSVAEKFTSIICPSLPELAGLLKLASGYVGNDSGVSHLAAAIGCPTVAIFGPLNPAHFRPLGQKVKVANNQAGINCIVDLLLI